MEAIKEVERKSPIPFVPSHSVLPKAITVKKRPFLGKT